jgi:hypothetical protein
MKKLILLADILFVIVLFIACAGLTVLLGLGPITVYAVNTWSPAITKTEVRLGDLDIQFFEAQATLKDFYIGNPQGLSPLKLLSARSVFIRFERASLLGNPLIIDLIEIDSPDIAYEITGRIDDFKALLQNMKVSPAGGDLTDQADNAAAQVKKKNKGRKMVIRDLLIRNAQVTAIMEPQSGKKQTLTLSELRLNNVGGSSGARPEKIARQVFVALYETIFPNSGPLNRNSGAAGNSDPSRRLGREKEH